MLIFNYTAVNERTGRRRQGTVEAISREDALSLVRKMGNKVINLERGKQPKKRRKFAEINITQPKSDASAMTVFFRELATLINAGIQLDEALSIVKFPIKDKQFSETINDIHDLVKSGYTMSVAMSRHPKYFPKLVVSLVRVAEMGGGLGSSLSQIATYIERDADVRKKMKSATSYPKFISGFFGIVLVGVIFGLLPKFKEIYASFGAELPGSTKVILGTSDFLRDHLAAELLLIAAVLVGYKLFKKSARGKKFIDKSAFSVPILGTLIHSRLVARFSGTLGVLLKSGVPLTDALKIAAETAENVYVDEVINKIIRSVSNGLSVGKQMSLYPNLFPLMVSSMVTVGERSGSLALMLEKIAEFSDQEFTVRVERLSKTFEPILMAGLGVIICVMVVALYLPVFQMTTAIH